MTSGLKIAAPLACRVGSTRLYGKPLQFLDIANKISILDYLISHLKSIFLIDQVVLAISEGEENKPFEYIAKKYNLDYIIGDQYDVLGRLIAAARKAGADVVFRVTSECPFIYFDGLKLALKKHLETKADLTVIEKLPEGAYFELINLSALERAYREDEKLHQKDGQRLRSEFCTLYISEHPDKFNVQKLIPEDSVLHRPDIRITVDYPEDLIVVRELHKALKKDGSFIGINDIINYLDSHPSLNKINNWIESGVGRIWD